MAGYGGVRQSMVDCCGCEAVFLGCFGVVECGGVWRVVDCVVGVVGCGIMGCWVELRRGVERLTLSRRWRDERPLLRQEGCGF